MHTERNRHVEDGRGNVFRPSVVIDAAEPALAAVIRGDLLALVHQLGLQAIAAMLEGERTKLCGERYKHEKSRTASCAGTTRGELALGGRRVTLRRPRVTPERSFRNGMIEPVRSNVHAAAHLPCAGGSPLARSLANRVQVPWFLARVQVPWFLARVECRCRRPGS